MVLIANFEFLIQLTLRNPLILIILGSLISIETYAQCAMCKAGAEQSIERGATDANWMNYGILFLMIIPFILIASLYWMYRQNKEGEQI